MALAPVTEQGFFNDPTTGQQLTQQNYRNVYDYTHQYLPHAMSKIVQKFNDQSILGFLDTMAYEEALDSDLAIWGEEGRLHKLHTGVARAALVFTSNGHSVRVGDKVRVNAPGTAGVELGIVTARNTNTFTAAPQNAAAWSVGTTGLNVRVYGTEFRKGTDGQVGSLTRNFQRQETSPIIQKAVFRIDGSDIPNIAWLHDPQGNPYWYIKDEMDEYRRFLNNIEYTLMLDELIAEASTLTTLKGTQGLWDSIESRGNVFNGQIASLDDIDNIVLRIEQAGGSRSNGMWLTTNHILAIDRVLADNLGYDAATFNFGVFGMDGAKDKVLNLGFKGYKRGTYEFHYMGWGIFQEQTAHNPLNFAAADRIHGILGPIGQTKVNMERGFDQKEGSHNVGYLTQLYKGKRDGGYSRKMETFFNGASMTPIANGTGDYHETHWTTERALMAAAMNKWMIFEGA